MQNSSRDNIILHELTYEKSQYKIANLSFLIASSVYILSVLLDIGLNAESKKLSSLQFKIFVIFCFVIIIVDGFFYYLDNSGKNLKYIISTWSSIIYFMALLNSNNTILLYSVIFLLIINLMYINVHITYMSCCLLLLCNIINLTIQQSNFKLLSKNMQPYFCHAFFMLIATVLIVGVSYLLKHFYRNSITIMQKFFSEEEQTKTTLNEYAKKLTSYLTKINNDLNSLESIFETYNQTTNELTSISRDVSKTSRALSNISHNLKKHCQQSNDLISNLNDSKSSLSPFLNTHFRNLNKLENSLNSNMGHLTTSYTNVKDIRKLNEDLKDTVNKLANLSSQTNLLSLNASIESARADSDSSGFDIVMEQLRSLTNNIHNTADILSEHLSDIEYHTNVLDTTFSSVIDASKADADLMENAKNDTHLLNANLENLLSYIANLSRYLEITTTVSDTLISETSELTPAITNVRSSAIDNSTNDTKARDSLNSAKSITKAMFQNLEDISEYLK